MTNQQYLQSLLDNQEVPDAQLQILRRLRERIEARLASLEGSPRFYYAGSYGKRTMIRERYDLDIVVYWPQDTKFTIKGIYDGVGEQLKKEFTCVKSKNVCWEIPFEGGFHIDVVPGRALDAGYKEANLHRTDKGTTLKTSIKTHIDTVRGSGRRNAIRLMKLWREGRGVPFKKSFLLEMMTISGCFGAPFDDLEKQISAALRYIRDTIEITEVQDPANSNNYLSDDISSLDKTRIKLAAQSALNATYWRDVFQR